MSPQVKVLTDTLLVLAFLLVFSSCSVVLFVSGSFFSSTQVVVEKEVDALLKWKSTLVNQNHSLLSSWKMDSTVSTKSPCKWYGITCNNQGSVAELHMAGLSLQGTLHSFSFSSFPNFVSLNFSSNQLSGIIPPDISDLPKLTHLDLSVNELSGYIPLEIGSLTSLLYLDLSVNQISGSIPTSICQLTSLTYLSVLGNQLTGAIPRDIGELRSLDTLFMSQNKLTGSIPASVGSLSKLRKLSLFKNYLIGSLQIEFSSLTQLELLAMDNNSLSGIIPTSIWGCTNLTYLNLGTNSLTGNIPNEIETARELRYLLLNDNNLSGTPPKSIGKLQYLKVLDLSDNKFEGYIPTEFCSFRDLQILSLKSNKFIGSIPQEINHLQQLRILDLSQNSFTSLIPKSIGNLKKLISRLNDTFSIDNYAVRSVRVKMVIKGSNIEVVILSSYTSAIDLSCNNFDGNIPKEITLLKGLYLLNLSHNHFSDNIPANLGDMSALESLDLSYNILSGHIPESLTALDSLGFLNLSYNKLSGKIPISDHFQTLSWDGSSVLGNDLLCGFPTDQSCEDDHNITVGETPTFEFEAGDREDANERLLLFGINALGFGVGFWGLFFVLLLKKEKWWFGYWRVINTLAIRIISFTRKQIRLVKIRFVRIAAPSDGAKDTMTGRNLFAVWNDDGKIVFEDIIEATEDFDAKYCIGEGGHGNVYRAELSTGQVVAVKKLHSSYEDAEISDLQSFKREVHALTKIRHRNIVKLFGFCYNLERRILFLVYEFVEMGSLKDVLRNGEQAMEFDWIKRVRFIKGTAKALAYMHHDCLPAIVHGDISSNNVFLNSEYDARVSAFGTARIWKPNLSDWISLARTYGFVTPEPANTTNEIELTNLKTEKCDVYSFGVIILEVLMGRHPSEIIALLSPTLDRSSSSSSAGSASSTKPLLPLPSSSSSKFTSAGKDIRLTDILGKCIQSPTDLAKKQIISFVKVGFSCLRGDPRTRPTMPQVSKNLSQSAQNKMPSSGKPFETITLGELLMDSNAIFWKAS